MNLKVVFFRYNHRDSHARIAVMDADSANQTMYEFHLVKGNVTLDGALSKDRIVSELIRVALLPKNQQQAAGTPKFTASELADMKTQAKNLPALEFDAIDGIQVP